MAHQDGSIIDRVTEADLRDFATANAVAKGKSYQRQSRVVLVTCAEDGAVAIYGICSCPVGVNCKHVVAAVLQAKVLRSNPGAAPQAVTDAGATTLGVMVDGERIDLASAIHAAAADPMFDRAMLTRQLDVASAGRSRLVLKHRRVHVSLTLSPLQMRASHEFGPETGRSTHLLVSASSMALQMLHR